MNKCRHCGEENREGSILCRLCGKELRQTLVVQAHHEVRDRPLLPLAPTEPELTFMILVSGGVKPVTLPYGEPVTVGRAEREGNLRPHIDLSLYGAMEYGVSRLHARIQYTPEAPMIVDLGSTNGTYLNGHFLLRDQPHFLRYGDELRLGKLVMYIYTQ